MPVCQNCRGVWSFKQTVKKMFTLDTAMTCPCCGEKQYYTKQAKKRSAVVTFLVPFVILLTLFDISPYLLAGIYLIFCVSIMAIFPFLIELSNEEESLW